MSIKIYNGYYSPLSIEQLLLKFKSLVKEFERKKETIYTAYLHQEATLAIDRKVHNGENVNHYQVLCQEYEFHKKRIQETMKVGINTPHLDFSVNCCVFPMHKKTLILLYENNVDLRNMWEDQDFIHDYHYQDQTDRPKHITEQDWEKRKNDWTFCLGHEVAAKSGYCFTFTTEKLPPFLINHLLIPSKESRARLCLYNTWISKKCKEPRIDEHGFYLISDAFDSLQEFEKTDDFVKELKSIQDTLVDIDFRPKTNNL